MLSTEQLARASAALDLWSNTIGARLDRSRRLAWTCCGRDGMHTALQVPLNAMHTALEAPTMAAAFHAVGINPETTCKLCGPDYRHILRELRRLLTDHRILYTYDPGIIAELITDNGDDTATVRVIDVAEWIDQVEIGDEVTINLAEWSDQPT